MKGIKQLARHLDLSIGTVSRALNNRPDVNAGTRKRVIEAAIELGYVPNQSGRSLRAGATNAVGFMLESGTASAVGGDNFFMSVIGGVQGVLMRHNLDLVMLPCGVGEDPYDFMQRMVARRFVDAMIITATQRNDRRIELLTRSRIPFVALGRSLTGGEHAWIDLDFEGVASDAVARFVAQGHRRIAVAVPRSEANLGYLFRDAYREALERHGIPYDPACVIRVESSEAGGFEVANRILGLDPRPTAVLLVYELMAIGLYHGLQRAGVLPGRDIAVIGFRENPQARFLTPKLSCYRLSLQDLGDALGRALLALMPQFEAEYPEGVAHTVWPMTFAEGESDVPAPPMLRQAQ